MLDEFISTQFLWMEWVITFTSADTRITLSLESISNFFFKKKKIDNHSFLMDNSLMVAQASNPEIPISHSSQYSKQHPQNCSCIADSYNKPYHTIAKLFPLIRSGISFHNTLSATH